MVRVWLRAGVCVCPTALRATAAPPAASAPTSNCLRGNAMFASCVIYVRDAGGPGRSAGREIAMADYRIPDAFCIRGRRRGPRAHGFAERAGLRPPSGLFDAVDPKLEARTADQAIADAEGAPVRGGGIGPVRAPRVRQIGPAIATLASREVRRVGDAGPHRSAGVCRRDRADDGVRERCEGCA